jgi:holin-like protein
MFGLCIRLLSGIGINAVLVLYPKAQGVVLVKLVRGFIVIMIFLFLGNKIAVYAPLPIPGNIIAMILFLAALNSGVVPLGTVEEISDLLLTKLALFFVPAGVGIMVYFDLLRASFFPLLVGTFLSTMVVLIITAKTAAFILSEDKPRQKGWE